MNKDYLLPQDLTNNDCTFILTKEKFYDAILLSRRKFKRTEYLSKQEIENLLKENKNEEEYD